MRGNNNVGKAALAVVFGLGGAYFGFVLQERLMEEQRVAKLVEEEAQKRFRQEKLTALIVKVNIRPFSSKFHHSRPKFYPLHNFTPFTSSKQSKALISISNSSK
ncbi:hypothetical protein THRCLA_22220 [Thraustotheca clavata]|uniref:Uncharacterized protein n=1 Tax=Thraustotheca clavata TaxID=74557 RepID=A0A1V9Z9Y1_9STRA|nr:hypothetical protein THRCLA_22220 [Thraustotheca clavata]